MMKTHIRIALATSLLLPVGMQALLIRNDSRKKVKIGISSEPLSDRTTYADFDINGDPWAELPHGASNGNKFKFIEGKLTL
jgi:hypothetical protein